MNRCDFGNGPCKAQGCDCCTAAGHEGGGYNNFNYYPIPLERKEKKEDTEERGKKNGSDF